MVSGQLRTPAALPPGKHPLLLSQSGRYWEEKNLFPMLRIEPQFLDRPACCPVIICPSIYLWLYSPYGPWPLFQLLNLMHSRYDSLDGGSALIKATAYTQNNKRTQTPMPWVGFEPTIPVFERAKTVHALDRTATLIGSPVIISTALSRPNPIAGIQNLTDTAVCMGNWWSREPRAV
jgi:hypothetical protein